MGGGSFMETSARPHGVAACAMLPSERSCIRYLLYVAAVLISIALWVTQYEQVKTNPRAAYIIVNPKPSKVLFFNVSADVENHTSRAETEAKVRLWTVERAPREQWTESSYPAESVTPTDGISLEHTKDYTPARSNDVDESFMREREKVYEERRRRVQEVCHQLGSTASYGSMRQTPLNRLRWLNSHGLIMCFNAKVGTTTWSQYMLERTKPQMLKAGEWHAAAQRILTPPYQRHSRKTLALMKEFGKIMTVRHPFGRLVSAYLDKMKGTQYLKLQRRIVAQYGSASSSSSPSSSPRHPTFEEFVRYLVAVMPPEDDVTTKYREGPSNVHWRPFYVNCAPCNIDYDVILNMDTINEDTRYVSARFGLGLEEGVWNNRAATNSSEVTALEFFKALPRNLTLALHQRYRVDFLMFGYSVTPFLAET